MTRFLIPLAAVFLAACSTPKYTYLFDKYDYNSGRYATASVKATSQEEDAAMTSTISESPLRLDADALLANADLEAPAPLLRTERAPVATAVVEEEPVKSYKEMTRAERREFRKEAKALVKTYIKAKKEGDEVKAAAAAQAMDHDLKMAAIFGAVGIVALIIGGDVFWIIGGIALIIGVVFFVLWLSRQ
ncbi:MAG TPA: hypothetical protein VKZ86_09200 [Cyclobacteriaceae bacterium]|nr:hypothetical protein [Cyclobacteriaceae bacterium]